MVTSTIIIQDEANRIFNIIKGKYELKNKSEAINKAAELLAPTLNVKYRKK